MRKDKEFGLVITSSGYKGEMDRSEEERCGNSTTFCLDMAVHSVMEALA